VRIGSFNVGMAQKMLTSKKTGKHMEKVQEILATCVQDAGLHVFSFCELGGHRQGLEAASIDYRHLRMFKEGVGPKASVDENYMTAWNFGTDDTDASQLSVFPIYRPTRHTLGQDAAGPQLVVHMFTVGTDTCLIHGNLHIPGPTGMVSTRTRIVEKALKRLEATALSHSKRLEATAFVLVGDCNLSREQGEEAVQSLQPAENDNWSKVWHVHTTTAAKSGDILFVKGAHAAAFDLPFGVSHRDRGVRSGCHDAIGVELRILRKEEQSNRVPQTKRKIRLVRSGAERRSEEQSNRVRKKIRLEPNEATRISRSGASQPASSTGSTQLKVRLVPNEATHISRSGASQPATPTDATNVPAAKSNGVPKKFRDLRLVRKVKTRKSRRGAASTDATNVPGPSEESNRVRKKIRRILRSGERLRRKLKTRKSRSGASQPASFSHAADAPAPSGLSNKNGDIACTHARKALVQKLEKSIRDFWKDRADGGALQHEAKELRSLLFAKKKHPVSVDVWMPGAAQPGETQYVNAVVSEVYVLRQLRGVIDLRETWLKEQGLPMDFQMRDEEERPKFLQWAKAQYHAKPGQRERQTEDWNQGGPKLVQKRKHGRWNLELQRRLGSIQLWHIVSFSGRFDAEFLRRAGASQPDTEEPSKQRELTREAQKLRDRLRWAEHLFRKQAKGGHKWFSHQDKELLLELQSGALRRRANDATERSGFGRIRNEDGTYKDIGPNTGGLTRTILDNWTPCESTRTWSLLNHESDDLSIEDPMDSGPDWDA